MKKRTFIKLSSTLLTGTLLSPRVSWQEGDQLRNWAGNMEYSSRKLSRATSMEHVQELVKKFSRVKVLGTRHCFNRIADSADQFISLQELNKVVALNEAAGTVTVEAGMNYGQLCPYLDSKGFALHNLASLPHISIAGACATATHGSGTRHGNLATAVSALEIVDANGKVHQLSAERDGDTFKAAVVNLGALGVVTKVSLKIQPTFLMRQYVYEKLPLSELKANFEEIVSAGYSVSLFTDWQADSINEVWIKNRMDDGRDYESKSVFFGASRATKNLHPIAGISAENCTEQMGVPGPWYERMPHFRMGFTPSSGKELQSEYFIPRQHAVDAIFAVSRLREQLAPHLFISEIRTIAADDLWMSPCFKQPCVTLHFTWKPDWAAVSKLLPELEKQLAPFNARPHWGKLFSVSPARLKTRYEKLPAFQQLARSWDPGGKFRNDFLNRNIFQVNT